MSSKSTPRYFLDTEFIENGHKEPLILLSIGIVDENGRWYYAENAEASLFKANDWVQKNVIPYLKGPQRTYAEMRKDLIEFLKPEEKPEIWGYFADYDWVLFAQIFGTMMDLPDGMPMYCRDLKQYADLLGVKKHQMPPQTGTEHHALEDARWNLEVWKFLENLSVQYAREHAK